ncbi:MAG: hypothetical protein U0R44_06370 [Candidatus Micrarchaeia archaeon]
MAERMADERTGARRLASPYLPPPFLQSYMTSPEQAAAYIRNKFGIADPGALRILDISGFTRELGAFLGPSVSSMVSRSPPLAVSVPDAVFDQMAGALGGDASAAGFYQRGSNTVFVRASLGERFDSVVRHELAHYVSFIARQGGSVHATLPDSAGVQKPFFAQWLEEGLSDYVCYRAAGGAHSLTYPLIVSALSLIANSVGEGVLERAFGSGDYAQLARAIDGRFGPGSFNALLREDDPLRLMHTVLRMGGLPHSRPSGIGQAMWDSILMYAANVTSVFGQWHGNRPQGGPGQ